MDSATRDQRFKVYTRAIVAIGAMILLFSIYKLPVSRLGFQFLIISTLTIGISSRIIIGFFRFKSGVTVSDTFIFLTMILFDGEAAIFLGSVESLIASFRISKKWSIRAFNSAAMVCSTFVTITALRALFGPILEIADSQYSSRLIMALCTMAVVQYLVNSGLIAVAGSIRINQPVWTTWKEHYVWTSLTYLAGASAAGFAAKFIGAIGFFAFICLLPIIAILYFTYLTYIKNIETSAAQAEQAERHVNELQESEERFRSAFDHAPIGMGLVATDGCWMMVNHSLCKILGYSERELLKMDIQSITHPEDMAVSLRAFKKALKGKDSTGQVESRYIHKLGHEVWVLVGISRISDSKSKLPHLIFQIQDITHRRKAEQRLLHEAFHDALTGLPNRAWFMEQLRASLEQVKQSENDLFAVLFLDFDRFKVINDSLGHMIGDQLIIGIADRLRKCLRPGDKVARLGGDEFTILLSDIKEADQAIEVADRIQKEVGKPFNLGGHETYTTASIGIAFYSSDYQQPEELLRDADAAMYQAKSLGKARHIIFDKSMHTSALILLKLENDLHRAIDREEFILHYQPIVSLRTGQIVSFEALVRWQHPERGLVQPDEFISVAEETGCIVQIGQWVLREACFQMRRWQEQFQANKTLSISINLSTKQFAHSNLLEQIAQIIKFTDLDPNRLKLEITESMVMERVDVATGLLKQLKAQGIQLSIDDFGTGYSSLSYLHRLPIDSLKIDRSFVTQMAENSENQEIVRTIIVLAQNLGKEVVAEGVETREQLERLLGLKCDSAQGYLFSKPVSAALAESMILQGSQSQALTPYLQLIHQEDYFESIVSKYWM